MSHNFKICQLSWNFCSEVKKMWEPGAVINYSIIITIVTGIIMAKDRTLFKENGGTIELGKNWCELISKWLDYIKRKATTTKPIIAPGLILEISLTFSNEIKKIVQAHEIPSKMIINFNQTLLPFLLISNYTLAEKGTSRVSVLGTSDYCQITGTFSLAIVP